MSGSNEIHQPMETGTVMVELWERAASKLSKQELEWFAGALHLSTVLEGLGCLISTEGEASGIPSYVASGSLQDHRGISIMLFFAANAAKTIRGLVEVGSSASSRLRNPDFYRAAKGRM